MFRFERWVIDFVKKKSDLLFFLAVTVISLLIRIAGFNFVSADTATFLLPWYDKIKAAGGFCALGTQVGDYNILYQTIIALLTYIDLKPLYLFKISSLLFDYVLAFAGACFLKQISGRGRSFFLLVYTALLFLPTVVLNASYWGQCDAAYTSLIILFLFFLYKEKYLPAFLFLGLAFAFKLQTIFILPFAVCYYFYKKKFSILYFLVTLFSFWLTGLVAFFFGRNLLAPFTIYINQTATYPQMWMNATSFWKLLGNNYTSFHTLATLTTLLLCGLCLYAVLKGRKRMDTPEQFLNTAAWLVWVMFLFLPAMHERYTFLLDILLVLLAFLSPKYIKHACLSLLISLSTYGFYLAGVKELDLIFVFLYVLAFALFSYEIFKPSENQEKPEAA